MKLPNPVLASCVAVVLGLLLFARPVGANGRFPAGTQIVFDPKDSSHFIVSATFGLLETRNGGETFSWACDPVLGLPDQQDGMFAITTSGTTVAATFYTGIKTSDDGCSFRSSPDLAGYIVPDLTLSRSSGRLLAFRLRIVSEQLVDTQIVRSDDDGRSWADVGASLPAELQPLTIDIAPADSQRVYVSGALGAASDRASTLLKSSDGGSTFSATIVPETDGSRYAYIAAVHPIDPNVVYLRVDDNGTTIIWASDDGGSTFRKIFRGTGSLLGFAISPDGSVLAIGGPEDGLWIGNGNGTDLHRQSDVRPRCLGFGGGALYACADQMRDGFSIGRSSDLGITFEPVLRFDALCGATICGSDSQVAKLCPADWPNVAPRIGATCGPTSGEPVVDAGSSEPTRRCRCRARKCNGGRRLPGRAHENHAERLAGMDGIAVRGLGSSRRRQEVSARVDHAS